MTRQIYLVLLAGALALAAVAPASAQSWRASGPSYYDYTGALTPFGYFPPRIPSTWVSPNYVLNFDVPQEIYVPVPVRVAPTVPAFEPVSVATILLRRGATPVDLEIKPDTVVTWRNASSQDYTLVLPQSSQAGAGVGSTSQQWRVRANGSFSLAFHQPGSYDYYRLDEPDRRGRVIVSE